MFKDFYKGKKVLVTGHTGFKGTWLCAFLKKMGAEVYGYSLDAPTEPNLFNLSRMSERIDSEIGDIRDYEHLSSYVCKIEPDMVFHLAAQPIVRTGYSEPRLTYDTNVMGTVNILEAVRTCKSVISFVNVTTDKVYDNTDDKYVYSESDRLDGYDPYSNSKSCSELVTHSYKRSFFDKEGSCPITTARAGNVIGGGDFADYRIIPDCVNAAINNKKIIIRNPNSIRPFQHVLEPLYAYLLIAYEQSLDNNKSGCYNIGPKIDDCVTVGKIADLFCKYWGNNISWESVSSDGPHESNYLRLDCSLIEKIFGYVPRWNIETAVKKVIEWSKVWISGDDIYSCMNNQITDFIGG